MKFKRGQIPWNKGLTRKKDKRIAQPWLGKKPKVPKNSRIQAGLKHKGKILTENTKEKMRESALRRVREGTHNWWKGGVTPERVKIWRSKEYKLWRKSVFERDNYTCVWCGNKNGNGKTIILNADHIKPFSLFPELRFAIDNGRTLCVDCHRTTDTFGSRIFKYKKSIL